MTFEGDNTVPTTTRHICGSRVPGKLPSCTIHLSLLQLMWEWCFRDPNQATSPLFLPPEHGLGNWAYLLTPTNVHASPLGGSLSFLRLSQQQTSFTESPRSPMSETYRLLQGPSRLRRRIGAFSIRVMKFRHRFPAYEVSINHEKETVCLSVLPYYD